PGRTWSSCSINRYISRFTSRSARVGRIARVPYANWGMSKRNARIQDAEAYLLHSSAWRETSLLIQAFARDFGVVSLAARGAKRPYSVLRPVLSAFQPLAISWSGTGEVKTLTRAECVGVRRLSGRAHMS